MAGHATRSRDSTPCHRFVPPGIGLHYSETAANAGCVLVSFGGAGRKLYPCVVHFGSREPFFSTNPFSIGAPGGGHSPAVLDFAASMVAGGKVAIAKANGLSLPEGCIARTTPRVSAFNTAANRHAEQAEPVEASPGRSGPDGPCYVAVRGHR